MPVRGSILEKFIKDALRERSYPNTLYWHKENEIFYLSCYHAKNKDALAEQNNIYEAWDKIKPRKNRVGKINKKQRFQQALKSKLQLKYFIEVKSLSSKNKKAYKFGDPNIDSPEQVQNDHPGVEKNCMMLNCESITGIDLPELVQNGHPVVKEEHLMHNGEPSNAENNTLQSSGKGLINNHGATNVSAVNGLLVKNELFSPIPSDQSSTCYSLSEQNDGIHANTSHFQSAGTITYDSVSVAASYIVRETGNKLEFISKEDKSTSSDKCMVVLHCNKSSEPPHFANLNL